MHDVNRGPTSRANYKFIHLGIGAEIKYALQDEAFQTKEATLQYQA